MGVQSYYYSCVLVSSMILALAPHAAQLQSSQAWSLLRIQELLHYPSVLNGWHNYTDFCYDESNPSATVVCYGDSLTQLHIIGAEGSPPLPENFSIDSFFTTLTRLPDLKVLTLASLGIWGPLPPKIYRLSSLEIVNMSSNFLYGTIPPGLSHLQNLQTLILNHNLLDGWVPDWLDALPLLAVLDLSNNALEGPLPESIGSVGSLRILAISSNNLSGNLPDLSSLANFQVLNLENNSLGPEFPKLGRKVVTILLNKNKFGGSLPAELSSFYLLQRLDVSFNRFVGPFMPSLLSLPSIHYLSIAGNKFTGLLFPNMSCNDDLEFVDLSLNLLTGSLPSCLSSNYKQNVVLYPGNCLSANTSGQHPYSFCQNQALAVGIMPEKQEKKSARKVVLLLCAMAAIIASALLVGIAIFYAARRASTRRAMERPPRRLVVHASSGYPSKLLADARYISQTVKLGALGIPSYRSFSLVELEAATNNFELSSTIGQDSCGQMYRGILSNGTWVTIRCLKVKKNQTSLNLNRHIELISKLRHRHLVSALGHCFEHNFDDSTVSRMFLVFEYVSHGNLRNNISRKEGQKLTWAQRITAAIGVAKGLQFLHGGIMPGLFANNLKITSILLDQCLVAKINRYNLPLTVENLRNEVGDGGSSIGFKEAKDRIKHGDKIDIYDFGVILLEIVTGRPIIVQTEVEEMKDQLQSEIAIDGATRKKTAIDPAVIGTFSDESLKTVIEICLRCLMVEPMQRPSVEDVIWNLQFAAQVQDTWRGDSQSSEADHSPLSPSRRI